MRFTKTMLCVTCVAPSGMNLQWRMNLFTPEFTTWVGLPTHKHYILPFTSAHWLSTQLDFKTISGHWVKIQSINETAVISLVHNDVITCCLQIGFFQSIRPAKWPIRFDCVTNKPVDCSETKHDWKSHVLCGLFTWNVSSKME